MAVNQTFRIKGMHCASCASIIEKTLKKEPGVSSVEVNFGTERAKIFFDESQTNAASLSRKVEPLGYEIIDDHKGHDSDAVSRQGEDHRAHTGIGRSKKEKQSELADLGSKVAVSIPLAVVSIFVMAWDILVRLGTVPSMPLFWEEFFHHLLPVIATYMLFVVGKPYLKGFYLFLRRGKANMDTLIGMGTLVAFLYSFAVTAFEASLTGFVNVEDVYYDVTIIVIAFITLGKYLEARSKLRTGDAIEKLLHLQAKKALVVRNGKEVEIPIEEVVVGDVIIVKPSGKIPVDGVILDGESFIDESMITGEPMPEEKQAGDSVVAGTLNTSGTFTFKATRVGSETMLAHIIKLVEDAQGSKAPIQALADKISSVFVPSVLVLSVIALGAWLLVGTEYLGFSQALSYGLVSFVGILVIACPCALGLATPTAIIVGVGKGAGEGILVKDAATLEKLHKVKVLVVDKTGTLTKGKPELTSIKNLSDKSDEAIISILASLEQRSEHPIAHAILAYAKEKHITVPVVEKFEALKGKGVVGIVNGVAYYAGNVRLAAELRLGFDTAMIEQETLRGNTPVILATKEKVLGVLLIADAVKPESNEAIARLHKLGIRVVMLTGDDANTAKYIASKLGIDDVVSGVLPEDKLKKIQELQKAGMTVAMAGDGVNDAPALAQADVGIAMATGTDVAIESAGITLLHGDISKLVKAVRLSKMTMRGIKQNLFWAFAYNVIGIPVAGGIFFPFFGWLLSPVFAGLAMALSSVSVVGNSLRLKTKRL